MQYMFYEQWQKLLQFAHEKNIRVIGDIPLYVALKSADVWHFPQYFQVELQPNNASPLLPQVSGVPDQKWGHPVFL